MSIAILENPFEISLSKNPINYSLKTNNLYDGVDIYPSLIIRIMDMGIQSEGFGFDIIDPKTKETINFYFTAENSPLLNGEYYQDDSFIGTLSAYTVQVLNSIKLNDKLNSFFDLELLSSTQILFKAKEPISELVPTNLNLRTVGGHLHITTTLNSNFYRATIKSDYKLLITVLFEDEYLSNNWREVAVFKEVPDNNGNVNFDISEILNAEIEASFSEPPLVELDSTSVVKSNLLRRYYVSYSELYNNNPNKSIWTKTKVKYVYFGGVSIEDYSRNLFFDYLQSNQKFLSWSNNKKLHEYQNDWLGWINYTDLVGVFKVKIKLYYKDGTNSSELTVQNLGIGRWESIIIPVGYFQRDIDNLAGVNDVFKWEIYILDFANNLVSEKKQYYLDCNNYECKKEIVFLNALNIQESVLTIGEWEKNLKINKTFGEKTLKHDYLKINGQTFQFKQESLNTFKARTGYFDKNTAEYLQDMFIEKNVFLIENVEYTPIVIKSKSIKIEECLTFLNQIEFEVEKSNKIENYSKEKNTVKLDLINNCGIESVFVDTNNTDISTFQDLSIFQNNTLIFSVIYNPALNKYVFPTKLTKEGEYKMEVSFITSIGQTLSFSKLFDIINQKALFETDDIWFHAFTLQTFSTNEVLYANWGNYSAIAQYSITPALTTFLTLYFATGIKNVQFNMSCPDLIKYFDSINNNINNSDLSMFNKIEHLRINGDNLNTGNVDISYHPDLINVFIEYSLVTSINIGLHKNIELFVFRNNDLSIEEIENILLQIWKWRIYYKTTIKWLLIYNNPGTGINISAKALSIINGTGVYVGEGLQSNYNFNVIY